jgi:hypothetical protein
MWLLLSNAFFSIVTKDCPEDHLLVRARRSGDIERVFGQRIVVERLTDADYLFRAPIPREEVKEVIARELDRIYFKNSVADDDLHHTYQKVWTDLARSKTHRLTPVAGRSNLDERLRPANLDKSET